MNKRQRKQEIAYLRKAVAIFGEDVMFAIIEAVEQKSELPLAALPDKWRNKAVAAFRQQFR